MDVTPSARRLTESLRDIGYDFVSALADIVDNSISADASRVDILLEFDGADSRVVIADDGIGMSRRDLTEALRFGTRRDYKPDDLGRFGLGLKTASISQCRRLTVMSRMALVYKRVAGSTLDLRIVAERDRWSLVEPDPELRSRSMEWLADAPGTVVIWDVLDRVLPAKRSDGAWARRRLEQLAVRAREHLGMVFHRYIEGVSLDVPLVITINGEKVLPWNPFAPEEQDSLILSEQQYEVSSDGVGGVVRAKSCVLPARGQFSSHDEFERLGGPRKWNRQQGFYIYRADRMIQSGGWSGIRAADEHTKLARIALDFDTDLDSLFRINVSKMRASLPSEIRSLIERQVNEVCHAADRRYRGTNSLGHSAETLGAEPRSRTSEPGRLGAGLIAAAMEVGEYEALDRIGKTLRRRSPELADQLGW
ncbi:MAG: ATP-binding protein [Actinobacteria bacterium]|nr:ATP-binding protein [Actinomycetota bacterium]